MKKVLIFGITGQDGILLSSYLLKKKRIVYGIYRNKEKSKLINKKVKLFYRKQLNRSLIEDYIYKIRPSEIYFLIGKSSSFNSHKLALETINENFSLFTYVVESIKKYCVNCHVFYASSMEIFGNINKKVSENSKKNPQNPYALAKHLAMEYIKFNRNIYKLNLNTGILFNHDSKFRGKNNVIMKVITYLNKNNFKKKLQLGPIGIYRDWGLANEFVKIIYKINQHKKSDDYIIATGKAIKLESLIKYAFKIKKKNYLDHIKINKNMFNGNAIKFSCGDIKKIKKKFNWKNKTNIKNFLKEMIPV